MTEKIFRWPGLGNMAVDAMVNRDGPLIMGTVLVAATAMLIATLLADGVTAWLNPKSRQGPTGQI